MAEEGEEAEEAEEAKEAEQVSCRSVDDLPKE